MHKNYKQVAFVLIKNVKNNRKKFGQLNLGPQIYYVPVRPPSPYPAVHQALTA